MTKSPYKRRKRKFTAAIKIGRVCVSLLMLLFTTVLATSVSYKLALMVDWVARIQIMPLALAGAGAGFAIWLGIALLFGRFYCSWVCPMGTLQDIFAHPGHRSFKHRYHFCAPHNALRYLLLLTVITTLALGIVLPAVILDPYSAFMRIATNMLRPAATWLVGEPVVIASWLAFAIAALTLVAVAAVAYWRGRLICNTICPVGSLLSCFSRYALFHFDIDTDVCVNCHRCERACKAECINTADHVVDSSRCVMCFNCIDACDSKAIRYTARRKKLSIPMMQRVEDVALNASDAPQTSTHADSYAPTSDAIVPITESNASQPRKISRRKFMATGLIVASAAAVGAEAAEKKRIKPIVLKQTPLHISTPVVPPGRDSFDEFLHKCTGCGLCVAHCPNHVIRPASTHLGVISGILHPMMDYDASYCLYNCTRCSHLCPTGALRPINEEEKHIFIIGHAFLEPANCIGCGQCQRRCPRQAITMVARPASQPGPSHLIPKIDQSLCIGCGACQYICPATPQKAIGVNGIR